MSSAARAALFLIRLYKKILSPLLPRACRFEPTCSVYASVAPAVTTGASFTARTAMVLLAVLLTAALLSVTTTEMLREVIVLLTVGSSELELYCTERSRLS